MSEDPSSLFSEFEQAALVSVEADSDDWTEAHLAIVGRAALAALTHAGADITGVDLAVRLSDNAAVHALNREYRDKDKPTNVLSFPAYDAEDVADALAAAGEAGPPVSLGDMIMAFGVLEAEAARDQKPLEAHLAHLAVHGVLHLLGHDHMTDAEADAMEALEVQILSTLDIANPYAADHMPAAEPS